MIKNVAPRKKYTASFKNSYDYVIATNEGKAGIHRTKKAGAL